PPPDTYTLSLHDALPISKDGGLAAESGLGAGVARCPSIIASSDADSNGLARKSSMPAARQRSLSPAMVLAVSATIRTRTPPRSRSEEHTSELQSRGHLVC